MNMSRGGANTTYSNNNNSNNVLSERVSRISEKINEIHVKQINNYNGGVFNNNACKCIVKY
jgi:flagellar biosynthesis/type III secretory pathway chaperone